MMYLATVGEMYHDESKRSANIKFLERTHLSPSSQPLNQTSQCKQDARSSLVS